MFIGFPIFTQIRVGLNNKLFKIYKFKTLYDGDGDELSRTSSLGNFIRKTKLDELPQLINVIKNEMSLVGPRPLLAKYIKINNFRKNKRNKCKPGITGLAQIYFISRKKNKNKNKNNWMIQFDLDVKYIKNVNLVLDMSIIIKTFLICLNRRNLETKFREELTKEHFI
jgi:lipopolysaccharide/colanic/teichoic acid biosynthesis glycosyltransferase